MTQPVITKNRLLLKALNRLLRELEEDLIVVDRWPQNPIASGIGLKANPDHLVHVAIDNWDSRPKNMIRDVRFEVSLEPPPADAEGLPSEAGPELSDLSFAELQGYAIQHFRQGAKSE